MEVQTSSKRPKRKPPAARVSPRQETRARFFLGSGYTPQRVAEILQVPVWYCELIKAGGIFARYANSGVPVDVIGSRKL